MNFNNYYFKENTTLPDKLYHGRTSKNQEFNLAFVGKQEATDQEGPGFYFSTNKDDASSYAYPNGIVITVEHNFKNLITDSTKSNRSHALKLLKMAPELDMTLTDWGYDPPYMSKQQALDELFDSVFDKDDAKDTFLSIWMDAYHRGGHDSQYVKNMVKLGYDGLLIDKKDNLQDVEYNHVVVYDPTKINIIDVEDYKKDLDESYIDNVKKGIKKYNVTTNTIDGKLYLLLYHGTSKANHTKILKSGKLKTNTYLSHDEDIAKRYAKMTGSNNPTHMIVSVAADGLAFDGTYFYTIKDLKFGNSVYK